MSLGWKQGAGAARDSLRRELATQCPLTFRFESVAAWRPQADSRTRPRRRRAFKTARPARVDIRCRKPCLFALLRVFGWNVRFISPSFRSSGAARLGMSPERGGGPVKQVQSTRQDGLCTWRAKTRVHQTAGTGPGNLAHERSCGQAAAPRQAAHRRCTILEHPASSPRRPHLWMLVWRTSRPEGLELVTEAQQLWNDCSDSLRSQVS